LIEHHQRIGQVCHFFGRVCHIEHRHLQVPAQGLKPGQHFSFARAVERGQRFIQQQQVRLYGQSAGNGHALALAARQRGGVAGQQLANAQHLDGLLQRLLRAGLFVVGQALQSVVQIAPHAQVVEQAGFLKHHAQPALPQRGEGTGRIVLPDGVCDLNPAPPAFQSGHAAQQAGLARTRGPPQHGDALRGQVQRGLQGKSRSLQQQVDVQGSAHRALRWLRWRIKARPISTAKANTTMPPASRWACAYSMASTWP